MVKLNSFNVVRYRGIDGLSLSNMSKVNLITGENGVGKTALIEAMWLFTGRYNPTLLWNTNVQRTQSGSANPLSRLTDGDLELRGVENGKTHDLRFSFVGIDGRALNGRTSSTIQDDLKRLPPPVGLIKTFLDGKRVQGGLENIYATRSGSVLYDASPDMLNGRRGCVIDSIRFQNETSEEYLNQYSELVREGRKKDLVRAINLVVPNIEEVEILTDEDGESYLSATISGGQSRPLHDLGGGAVRLARLLIGFSASQGAILLSDELENGIHYSAQRKIWDSVRQWREKFDVQFVATTHSAEFIDAAIDAFAECREDLSIHKIFRNRKTSPPEVATFTGDALVGASNMNLEVR